VIVPLEEHRGHALPCVRAWVEQQDFAREEFELVIASPPNYPASELDELDALLAPQDELLHLEHHHDMDLCVEAAEAAHAVRSSASTSMSGLSRPKKSGSSTTVLDFRCGFQTHRTFRLESAECAQLITSPAITARSAFRLRVSPESATRRPRALSRAPA
jgi:hypothetical protein